MEQDAKGRRDFLKLAGGAALAGLPFLAADADAATGTDKVLYAHGMVWNRDTQSGLKDTLLKFDVRATINGSGFATICDDIHDGWNAHIAINKVEKQGNGYALTGEVIANLGLLQNGTPVSVQLDVKGIRTIASITISDVTLTGAGIIAILIGL